ncbi:MAG: DUF5615 family PIN-like protein, partial [Polyangiaceae bacterium]
REHGYVVFTHDLDFGTLLALTRARGPSVVQVRTQNVLPVAIGNLVVRVLTEHGASLEAGALVPARTPFGTTTAITIEITLPIADPGVDPFWRAPPGQFWRALKRLQMTANGSSASRSAAMKRTRSSTTQVSLHGIEGPCPNRRTPRPRECHPGPRSKLLPVYPVCTSRHPPSFEYAPGL